jgi:hypothetical protein
MRRLRNVVMMIFCGISLVSAQTGVTRVWAVDDGEKVRQDDLTHWAASSVNNIVWNGSRVSLFGARNEVVAFQLIIEAGNAGAQQINVRLDSLSTGTSVIKNTGGIGNPYDYVGKHIELFVEHYTNVTQRSPFYTMYGMTNSRPLPDADHLGWIPDALVPFEAPVKQPAHGQGGAPFNISGGKNQAVWVDVYIPKTAEKGLYTGQVIVTENGTQIRSIPLELRVFDFMLPDENHQNLWVAWNEDMLPNRAGITYNSAQYWQTFQKYMNFSHRHRIDLVDGRRSLGGTDGFVNRLGGYYTGAYYTPSFQYEGPGMNTGDRVYSIGTYDQPNNGGVSGFSPNTQAAWQSAANAWEQWFLDNAPAALRFKYMDDEGDVTDPAVVQAIKDKCSWITSSSGVGKNLHRFFTKEFVYGGFYGAIDFWALASSPGIQTSILNTRKAQGDKFCSYNGTRPMWGNMELIDNFATDNRVNPWISWKYGIDLLFFWSSSFYAEKNPPAATGVNAWDNNYIPMGVPFGADKGFGGGMLFYTGNETQYAGDSRGLDGPIGCIRLSNMRRGLQDYEYLWLAQQKGLPVATLVDQIVPHALDDWGSTSYTSGNSFNQQPTFPTRGYVYENARFTVAQALEQASKTGGEPAGSISAYPFSLPSGGGEVTLTWASTNASTVTINNGIGAVAGSGTRKVTVGATTAYEVTFENPAGVTTAQTRITVEGSTGTTGQNVVRNSDFSSNTDEWNFYTNGTGSVGIEIGKNSSNACAVTVSQAGTNVQLFQSGVPLQANTRYRLSFDALSTTGDDFQVAVQQHGAPYANYGLDYVTVDLTPSWVTYTFDFNSQNMVGSVTDGRLMFWLAPFAKAGDKYQLDNITLVSVGAATGVEQQGQPLPSELALLPNYPNPFNPTTMLRFTLPERSAVSLKIYDVLGREVRTLVDEVRAAGTHEVRFDAAGLPSGPYFCRLVTPKDSRVQRVLLMK